MNQSFLRFIIRLIIFVIKTGQVKNCIRALIWIIQTKKGHDEAMARLDGSYYEAQVEKAGDDYRQENPDDFICKPKVRGYDKWLRENQAK